jgi:3'-phosphoadenosine 5'-phosphosulfate sulfotransferase (PAPS reductase)/FAD synthetase
MKKNPAKKYEKATGLHPFIGTMAAESAQRKSNWIKYGCNAFQKTRPTSQPLSFWTEQDILKYIRDFNIPYAKDVYGEIVENDNGLLHTTRCQRTGCEFCLYGIQSDGCPNRLERIKEMHPKRYDFIMRPINENGLGYKNMLDWINEHGTINIKY